MLEELLPVGLGAWCWQADRHLVRERRAQQRRGLVLALGGRNCKNWDLVVRRTGHRRCQHCGVNRRVLREQPFICLGLVDCLQELRLCLVSRGQRLRDLRILHSPFLDLVLIVDGSIHGHSVSLVCPLLVLKGRIFHNLILLVKPFGRRRQGGLLLRLRRRVVCHLPQGSTLVL